MSTPMELFEWCQEINPQKTKKDSPRPPKLQISAVCGLLILHREAVQSMEELLGRDAQELSVVLNGFSAPLPSFFG